MGHYEDDLSIAGLDPIDNTNGEEILEVPSDFDRASTWKKARRVVIVRRRLISGRAQLLFTELTSDYEAIATTLDLGERGIFPPSITTAAPPRVSSKNRLRHSGLNCRAQTDGEDGSPFLPVNRLDGPSHLADVKSGNG